MGATVKNFCVIFNKAQGAGAGLVQYGDEDLKKNNREPGSGRSGATLAHDARAWS
jgi:hypothetical protein